MKSYRILPYELTCWCVLQRYVVHRSVASRKRQGGVLHVQARAGRSGAPFRRFRAVLGGSRGAVPVFAMAPMYRLDGEPLAVRAANVNADAEVEGRGHHVASPRLGRRTRRLDPACEVPRTAPDWPGQGRGGGTPPGRHPNPHACQTVASTERGLNSRSSPAPFEVPLKNGLDSLRVGT